MKKLVLLIIIMALCVLNVQAKTIRGGFSQIISDSGIKKDSIAISIRDSKTGKVVYALNDKIMMNPASVQKVLTMTASEAVLGKDYKFSTELYSAGDNAYIIKLSGDPYLKYADLKFLTKPVRIGTQRIYLDDSILDSKCWGEGWQWDDDMNELMPRFGAYNLDNNLITLSVMPAEEGKYPEIINPSKYPLIFINNLSNSNKTSVNITRDTSVSANTLIFDGTVAKRTTVKIPSNDIKRYFEFQLTKALGENKIYLKTPFTMKKLSSENKLDRKIEHELSFALNDILKNSNNMSAETVFKLAGGKYINDTGSDNAGIKMFHDFCAKQNLDSSGIKITDGSGVSKNNLLNADFISEFLYINKDHNVMQYLAKPSEGTLTQRLLPIKENLRAKTGTLSGISSIAGYITSKRGHNYVFCIIQNDVKLTSADKKTLEDYIIREIYLKL